MSKYSELSVKQIEALLSHANPAALSDMIAEISSDERDGVKKLVLKNHARQEKLLIEDKRIENMKRTEQQFYEQGYLCIAGTDEVGRGPLCGPVVSAVVILPQESRIRYINDSKKLTEKKREELYDQILGEAVSVGIGIVDHHEIDRINILNATKKSMLLALEQLSVKPDILLLDAITINTDIKQCSYIKGDANIYSIAAASIIAKVTRDRMMVVYDEQYPQYGFRSNKGYGSFEHMEAIKKYGLTPIHRRSFIHSVLPQTPRRTGQNWEETALRFLIEKGYSLIQKNYKRAGGEIDLILQDGDEFVFCEVKARSDTSFGKPEEFVERTKQQKLILTAQKYMAEKAIFQTGRFDVVAIEFDADGGYKIRHHANAFGA